MKGEGTNRKPEPTKAHLTLDFPLLLEMEPQRDLSLNVLIIQARSGSKKGWER